MLQNEMTPESDSSSSGNISDCKCTKNNPNYQRDSEKNDALPLASQATKPGEGIPLIPIDAMAGALTGERTVLEYECERYVIPAFKGADFLIPVKGSSMYPKYFSGDIVACQRVPMTDLFFQWNKVYVIDTNQGPLIKRIKPGSDKDHVLIVSDNEKYDPFEIPCSAIHAVALVIGVIRLE
ncbi:helix-turn-helix transcriptional regulator [Palleniella muris]|uniref:Helix-turn-helix transcriptional regulator n=1 Tax=Palleniella muris TaxID=3038145 RepID=A0AC61QRZ3_9BACT|nr:helix-turn-helix transcriptional regulator [Palleniella muris]